MALINEISQRNRTLALATAIANSLPVAEEYARTLEIGPQSYRLIMAVDMASENSRRALTGRRISDEHRLADLRRVAGLAILALAELELEINGIESLPR